MTTSKLSPKHVSRKVNVSRKEAMRKAAKQKGADAGKLVGSRLQKIKELLDVLDEEFLMSGMTDVQAQDESPINPRYERWTEDSPQARRVDIRDNFIQEGMRDVEHKIQSFWDERIISSKECQQFENQLQRSLTDMTSELHSVLRIATPTHRSGQPLHQEIQVDETSDAPQMIGVVRPFALEK